MGNCPACLSGRYSMIHDVGSEEGDVDQKVGELGLSSSTGGIKVVRVTDGKVFEYKIASSSDDDDDGDIDGVHMQRLRAKDVISKAQGADEGSIFYELFDQFSYTSTASTPYISNRSIENEKKKNKNEKSEEKGTYEGKPPLHPETLLKVSQVYYLRPICAAMTADYDHNILSNISCPAASATAAATKAATELKKKKEKKKVRFSDQVVFIKPPTVSSSEYYNHDHRQPDHVSPPTQLASVLPNPATVAGHDDDDGAPINERQLAAEGPVVRVKLLLSKRQLCDLLAATGQYNNHQELQQYHSQLAAADFLAEKSVASACPPSKSGRAASHLAPASLSSFSHQQAHEYAMRVS